ncbi:MAG: methionine--tRNA ligase [Planctomycetota bacterium]|jgi:methionine--tRNA ligase
MTAPAPACITTPIYYVNDRPHIGHVYTSTLCDAWARFMRRAGRDVFFLTGTDEHGVKVEKSARERGVPIQQHVDENAAEFQRVMGIFGLGNDAFIRTTSEPHVRQVQAFVRRLQEQDAIYLGEFEGWYDEGQEEYHTETRARELEYRSPISGKPLVRATERNYYFRLSAFQSRLEELYAEHPGFVQPAARRNEVLGRLRDGLQDVPISRTNFSWGIPMPEDPQHVIYVWIDALLNYVTALGLGDESGEWHERRSHYWPASVQVIGKEILWFHAVIWPAMLMALDLPRPGLIHAHSFWVAEGQKMSKSLGNFIDLEALESYVGRYGLDALRWYLVTQGPLGAQDADFRAEHFHEVYGTDLVNTVGNSSSRVTAMIGKYFDGRLPEAGPAGGEIAGHDWPAITAAAVAEAEAAMDRFDPAAAMEAGISLVRRVDAFINETEPFRIAKDPARADELAAILYRCLEALRIAMVLLEPVLPAKAAEFLEAVGEGDVAGTDPVPGGGPIDRPTLSELGRWGRLQPGTEVRKLALFPRVDAPAGA